MLMRLQGRNLRCYKIMCFEKYSGIFCMDSDFESVLDGLHKRIPSFDLSSLTTKDIVPLKAQHVLV
jgi:hypothetical protein